MRNSLDSTVIELTERVRDLGFILDKNLTMTYHTGRDMQKSNQCNQVHRARSQIERLKAHVHPNGFARLCFCFETILLSNAVF